MIELADATSRSEDCWNRIGVRGDHSCPELKQFVHCQNCPVFASAGRRLFAQRPPSGYAEEMLAGLTQAEPAAPSGALHSVLVFRIGEEWLALAVSVLVEVTPAFPVHSVPQRSGLLAGVVNIRGELQLCVRLDRLLGIALNSDLPAATLAVKSTRNAMSGSDRAGLHRVCRRAVWTGTLGVSGGRGRSGGPCRNRPVNSCACHRGAIRQGNDSRHLPLERPADRLLGRSARFSVAWREAPLMSAEQQFSLFDLFREEARTHADSLAQGLLALEADPTNPERLEPLMRAAHSIKGAARIVGLDPAVRLAHGMEDMFVAAQAGKIKIDGQDIDNLLAGTDLLASLAQLDQQSAATWGPDHAASIQAVIDALAVRLALPVASDRGPSPLVAGNAVQTLPADGQASASALAATVTSRHLQLTFPDGPLPGAGENPLFDLFLDEVRIHAASIQTCLLAEPGVAWSHDRLEQVAAALHAIGGAAQLLRVTPLVLWVRRAKEILAKSTIENGLSDDTFRVFWAALELLVELLGTKHADLAGWAEARAEKFADLTAQLKVGNTRPTTEAAASANRLAPVEHAVAATADATAIPAATTQLPAVDQPTSSIAAGAPGAAPNTVAGVVRVSAQSLNRLMGLAGESLVQARWLPPFSAALMELKKHQDRAARLIDDLAQTVSEEDVPGPAKDLVTQARRQISLCRQTLQERATEFDDHTALAEDLNVRLYREALVSRMRPFADGAQGFGRLIRDMARRLDKQATLELVGMNTEVDRDVLEKLEAPLTHLLRNAVDHGIEPPAERSRGRESRSSTDLFERRASCGQAGDRDLG